MTGHYKTFLTLKLSLNHFSLLLLASVCAIDCSIENLTVIFFNIFVKRSDRVVYTADVYRPSYVRDSSVDDFAVDVKSFRRVSPLVSDLLQHVRHLETDLQPQNSVQRYSACCRQSSLTRSCGSSVCASFSLSETAASTLGFNDGQHNTNTGTHVSSQVKVKVKV